MGAIAPSSPWIPEDDFLLKNAVEAGASLESLAKGAVQFSRKYSLGEIHDRWYTLLYNPDVPLDGMVGSELSAQSDLPRQLKFCNVGYSKGQKTLSVKRKTQSVRNCYYAMRKRIRKDVEASMDFNFLVDPENANCVVNGNEPLPQNCEPEGPSLNDISNVDPPHEGLLENTMDVDVPINGVAAQDFYTRVDDTVQVNFSIEPTNIPVQEETQILEGNMPLNGAAEELGVPMESDIDSFIRDDNLEEMSLPAFPQINNDAAILCSEFDEDYMFDSPELEGGDSFDNLQLSSLPDISDMPLWATEEDDNIQRHGSNNLIACEDVYLEELSNSLLNFTGEEELYLMDSVGKDGIGKSYYDGLSSLLLNPPVDGCSDQIPETAEAQLLSTPPDVKNMSVSCRAEVDDYAGKTETELLVASDAHITNLLVSCAAEVNDNAGKDEPELLVASDAHITNPSVSCRAEVHDNAVSVSQSNGVEGVHKSEFQMATSASAKDPQFPELNNRIILCKLNTEDPEVPSNDDVFLPFNEPTLTVSCSSESAAIKSNQPVPPSVNDYGYRATERGRILMQVEQKNSIGAHVSSETTRSHGLPRPVCGSKIQPELSNKHGSHTLSRSTVTASGGLGGNNNATNTTHVPLHVNPKEKPVNVSYVKHISSNVTKFSHEKPSLGNGFRNHVQSNGSSLKPEQDAALPLEDNQMQHAEVGSSAVLEPELVVNPQKLDEEEEYIESDEDVPYYSDVEAMVLDMDLDSYDHDFYENEEVSRYQHEETKRTIMRLEQGAHSHMQRSMTSRGALALLYGRHSTYYIKKTEVLLGRATDSVDVDIDLGKGGCAKLISRKQAVIKMDKDGSFYIKNTGRSLMRINDKELHTGQSQRLHSSYLIELRGLQFIFEINQSSMKR